MATLYVNSAWANASIGDVVDGHTYGTDAFSNIQSAVNAASTTEKTTINVFNGTYADDVYFRYSAGASNGIAYGNGAFVSGAHKADIDIVAAEGNNDVLVKGTFAIGLREGGTSNVMGHRMVY